MKNLFSKIFIILTVVSFFAQTQTHAQQFNLYSADDIIVNVYPQIPGPNTQVELSIKSYSFNLNNYYIAWFKNGIRETADYGNRNFTFTTGDSGTATDISLAVEYEGQVFRKEFRFVPSEVDLLWEAVDAYTPPFYRGKALPLLQSQIEITAIPETQLIAPSDAPKLVYYWDRNYKRDIPSSGFSKQSFLFEADPLLTEEIIEVTSNDRRENSFATNTLVLPTAAFQPKILFYEINENERLMTNKALNSNPVINGDTIKLSFHPLNLSTTAANFIDLFVGWNINNEARPPQNFEKQDELYITTNGTPGEVNISLELANIRKIMQDVEGKIDLIFTGN
ncbi:MAG: hypothetical protein ACPGTS_01370 [Minisyncoccia bacterium]